MMKNGTALLLCLALLVAALPAITPSAGAASYTCEQALEWICAQEGQTHGSGQCVHLVKAYYTYLVGWAAYGSGYDYQTNTLPNGWQRIPGGQAQPGDILLYDKTANNSNGHVALCLSEYVTYHQNYNEGGRGGPTKRIANLRYDLAAPNYWGVIRPVFSDSPRPGPSGFYDVPETAYYADTVLWAVEQGITKGIDERTFGPELPCTRGQAVTFLWRASGCPGQKAEENPFTDVSEGDYYYDAVLWAVEQGITNGMSETSFGPELKCSRAQIITLQWRACGAPPAEAADNPFTDVPQESYYGAAVAGAVEMGVARGMTQAEFWPDANCTRAQIVTFLSRQFD